LLHIYKYQDSISDPPNRIIVAMRKVPWW